MNFGQSQEYIKNQAKLSNSGISRSSSQKKSRPHSRVFENSRCDTADQGGGKPGSRNAKKLDYSKGFLRPEILLNQKSSKNLQGPVCVPSRNTSVMKNDSRRSVSQKKIKNVDLQQGIFSNKQSIYKKIMNNDSSRPRTSIGDWKIETRTPTPSNLNKNIKEKNPLPDQSVLKKARVTPVPNFMSTETSEYIQPWKKLMHEISKEQLT